MCDRCYHRAGVFLAALLGQPPATQLGALNAEQLQRHVAAAADANIVLMSIVPSLLQEGPEIDSQKLIAMLNTMGFHRVTDMVKLCGYLGSLIDDVNRVGVATLKGMATAGDPRAQSWFRMNAENIYDAEVGEVSDTRREQGPVAPRAPSGMFS